MTQDESAESPRDYDINLGIMACAHRRYDLGDMQVDPQTWQPPDNAVCVMPLWLYDHSGLSLRTHPHGVHAAWDCGMVGYVYTTRSRINKWFGLKKCDDEALKRAEAAILCEVETYSMYLGGDCYCIRITDPDGEEFDSGRGMGYTEMVNEAEREIDAYLAKK